MIFDRIDAFLDYARRLPADAPGCARGAFLLAPEGMTLAAQSAADNAYMDLSRMIDADRALAQHRGLQRALADSLPTVCFAGDPATPDAVFPNNVFATARVADEPQGRFLIGRMRHLVRQRESGRSDIHGFFERVLGYRRIDLRSAPGITELTGTLVIDRSRGIGLAGLSPRCDRAGVEAMHAAFGLRATFCFELAAGEYHTNVALSVLAGRALVIAPPALAEPALAGPLGSLFAGGMIALTRAEQVAFAGNCIALDPGRVWMSEAAADGLLPASRAALEAAGFAIAAVPLDEIEKAGGSLRCCVGEIF
jgi:N-dimethylarginine dimethylaminohydrolase